MVIKKLQIENFRNIKQTLIDLDPYLNVMIGENGSGKTSLIEALYYLSTAKSFRQRKTLNIIQKGQTKFSIRAEKEPHTLIEIQNGMDKSLDIRLNHKKCEIVELAFLTPVQLITPETIGQVFDESKNRRQFYDWIIFYLEPQYQQLWPRAKRLLKQRNAAIRSRLPIKVISAWDKELVEVSQVITLLRKRWFEEFTFTVQEYLAEFLPKYQDIMVTLETGWGSKDITEENLKRNLEKDLQMGYTTAGIHRASFHLKIENHAIQDVASRGERKLFTIALFIARGILLHRITQKASIYLIDDLAAELDPNKLTTVIEKIRTLNSQIILTTTQSLRQALQLNAKSFHVKQGEFVDSF